MALCYLLEAGSCENGPCRFTALSLCPIYICLHLQGPICQHGPEECLFNRVINCAQELNPRQETWFPYVQCLEGSLKGDFLADEKAAQKCAADSDVDYDAIKKCANGTSLSCGCPVLMPASVMCCQCFLSRAFARACAASNMSILA